jgi:hypothetical protein
VTAGRSTLSHTLFTATDYEVCFCPRYFSTCSIQRIQVARAQASKPPIQELGDRIAAVFVPVVCGLSLFTFLVWIALTYSGAVPERW